MQYLATAQRRQQHSEPYYAEQSSSDDVGVCPQLFPGFMHGVMEEAKLEQQAEDKPEEPDLDERAGR